MSKTLLMIGTQKGGFLLWSDQDRKEWSMEGPLLKGWEVRDLQLDIRKEPTIFAAVGSYVYGPCIHTSKDMGKSWRQIEHGPKYNSGSNHKLNTIWCVVPGLRDDPDTLYAGVDEAGLFRSNDGGFHWQELKGLSEHKTREEWTPGAGGLCCHSVLIDPNNRERLWVGISAVGVFRTDDGGKTWDTKNNGLTIIVESEKSKEIGSCVHRLLLDPRNPDHLYQQNHRGVFRSTDGADSWERIEKGLSTNFGFPMVMHPEKSNILFIIPQESDEYRFPKNGKLTVFRTTDSGSSWHPLNDGLPENSYAGVLRQAMAVDGCRECGVYFGTSGGQLYYSRDNGERWHTFPYNFPRIMSVSATVLE